MSTDPPRDLLGDRITVTLHHLVDELDAHADGILRAEHGLTYSQFFFLAVLSTLDRPDVTGLAQCLGVSKAAVSKRLPGLVEAGWVAVGGDPAHGRRVLTTLTPEGGALVAAAAQTLDEAFLDLFRDVRGLDLAALHADLKTLLTTLTDRRP